MKKNIQIILVPILVMLWLPMVAQVIPVGNGSYTTTFPGTDDAGRNEFPSGTPFVSGEAANKPVPTNDWWSDMIKSEHGEKAFNYPLSFRSKSSGLVVNYTIPLGSGPSDYREPMSAVDAIVIGVNGLAAANSTVSDHSDWDVQLNWSDQFYARMVHGSPFVYFEKSNAAGNAHVTVNFNASGSRIEGNKVIIENNMNNSTYVVFGPSGSTWTGANGDFQSSLNGQNYWSMVMLPFGQDINSAIAQFEQHAFVFPINTQVDWNYNQATGKVRTTFTVTTEVKEGSGTEVLQGLLPHHWDRLASDSPQPGSYTYPSVRGMIKMVASNQFTVENTFSGIIPTLPDLGKYTSGFDPGALSSKIDQVKNDGLATWTDSYNEGQAMNRLIQAARIADQMGNTEQRDLMVNTVRTRLEDWLTAESGEIAFLFYYNDDWDAMIGYPAGHRQDVNLNDHHFHWGYFIHAAAAIEQYNPGWSGQWGDMINMLVRDAANPSRSDSMFPFLRNFSPYAGHSWANGFATEPFGNDQESTSESMQFNSALIHWGTITGNTEIRDLGIYLYSTELSTIQEYWFDVEERSFQPEYNYEMVARVWGGGYDNGTWWTSDVAASYGIQLYPIHGGSLYLGHRTDYVSRVWTEMTQETPVLSNTPNVNLWYDTYWKFLSFLDAPQALSLYNAYTERDIKFGITDAQTYHWLHTMVAMGQVANEITADYPVAAVFNDNGSKTYVAHNYQNTPLTVNFSDGFSLQVPANSMATNRDVDVAVTLTTDQTAVPIGGNVNLTASVIGSGVTQVEFYKGGTLIGTDNAAPYTINSGALEAGFINLYAKVYVGSNLNISNVIPVQVGLQLPYSGTAAAIPGTIEAGLYDTFEGGVGQGIAYSDNNSVNQGDFRPDEWVDASSTTSEGATVGWIDPGEWLEYTVNASQAGRYDVTIRYASGNSGGGGPFWFEKDGVKISEDISVGTTGDWGAWQDVVAQDVNLSAGEQVIRIKIGSGGFNLGRMTFVYDGPPVDPVLTTIIVSPANATINEGENQQFSTQGFDQFGQPFTISPAWSANGGTINSSGLFNGTASGNFTVTATQGAVSGQANIQVNSTQVPVLTSIVVTPGSASLNIGGTQQFSAQGYDQNGNPMAANITWSTSGGTIDGSGLYSGDVGGNYVVTAQDGSVSGTADVVVSDAPAECTGAPANGDYTYVVSGDSNNPTITFQPGYAGVGNNIVILYYGTSPGGGYPGYIVTPGQAYQTNASQGQTLYFYYTYSVPEGGERNSAANMHEVVVGNCGTQSPVLSSIVVSPGSATIAQSATHQFSAQGYDQFGQPFVVNPTWSISGGSIDGNGLFTGTSAGNFTVTASSGSISGNATVEVTTSQSFTSIPSKIEAEDYNEGGEGVGYYDLTAGNTGGACKNDDVDIQLTTDTGQGCNVGWIDPGEWLAYSINATEASGNYSADLRVASPNGSGRLHLEIDGVDVTGQIIVPNTGNWQVYQTITLQNVQIAAGNHELKVVFDVAGLNLNYLEFKPSGGSSNNCTQTGPNDDYSVQIDDNTPALTFVPGYTGVGDGIVILYYGTSPGGGYPGYAVSPNTPYPLTGVTSGQTVYFYYTYSVPEGGERNSSASPHSFQIGNCNAGARVEDASRFEQKALIESGLSIYPVPVEDELNISTTYFNDFKVEIVDITGKTIIEKSIIRTDIPAKINVRELKEGAYLVRIYMADKLFVRRFIK